MKFTPATIPDILIIEPQVYQDQRGFFLEQYRETTYQQHGIPTPFIQENHSGSVQGVLRGLHYQIEYPQGKLIQVLQGSIYDVSVDLRQHSPYFKQWFGIQLSAANHHFLWIPPGFAHGFYVTSPWSEIIYKTTNYYHPEFEKTLRWNDPDLNITWPLSGEPVLSQKDANGLLLCETPVYTE